MDLTTISPPAAEPLSVAELAEHLRLDGSDLSGLLGYIASARAQVETFTRLRLITQTVQFTMHAFPARIVVPTWPIQSIAQIVYLAADGTETTLAGSDYKLVRGTKPRQIAPAYGTVWPQTLDDWNAVTVDVVVGFGPSGADVPQDILGALRMLAASFYEHRETEIVGAPVAELPMMSSVRHKLLPHVVW